MIELLIPGDLARPPVATVLITLTALLVNVGSSLIRKRFTDVARTRRVQKEVKEFNRELRAAISSRDKVKEEKLRKKQKKMNEMQMQMMSENMKTSMYFMLPLLLVWWMLTAFFGYEATMAFSPVPLPLLTSSFSLTLGTELNFFWWYMISSIAVSGVVTKLLGTSMTE